MAIPSGARVGRYEILDLLGAGGMGEVYRARDPGLDRTVALKLLPASVSSDPDRLRRFEHEARAAGALNHPNVLAVHDVGSHEGAPYIVSELLEGETLRARLKQGRLGPRKAMEYAIQVAQGLAAAHEKGILHRDLKPENLFLTRDGRVKILDFGLAKLHGDTRAAGPEDETATGTRPGVVLGTVAYLSPEQARGLPADARSDMFSLGIVLYEMLSGRRPFAGGTTPEVMTAILRDDAPAFGARGEEISPGLERIVRRCLEKNPEERFQEARDLGFALEVATTQGTPPSPSRPEGAPPPRRLRRWVLAAIAGAALVAAVGGAFLAGRGIERRPVPSYKQLTFRRGATEDAFFAPDGQTVVYGARWDGGASEVFSTRLDLPEFQSLSLVRGARPQGVRGGELLVLYDDGRLGRIPLVGGTPRDVAEKVVAADWADTGDVALVREQWVAGEKVWRHRLEYPIGRTVLESPRERPLRDVRLSRRGDHVALVVGVSGSNGGDVVLLDRDGRRTAVSPGWMEAKGLAWSPDGSEVWFTAGGPGRGGTGIVGATKALYAVSLSGRERLLLRAAGDLTLLDVGPGGRALVAHGRTRTEARARLAGDAHERDLTYLDGTIPMGISADGRAVLFQESGQAGGPKNTSFLFRVGDPGPVRLGEGTAVALSPNGRLVLVQLGDFHQSGNRLVLLSAGADPPRELPRGPIDSYGGAAWLPDGERLVVSGAGKGQGGRLYVQRLPPDGDLRPISPEGWTLGGTPSAHSVPCFRREPDESGRSTRVWGLCPVEGGLPREAPWLTGEAVVLGWSDDDRHALVADFWQPPFRVFRVDTVSGRREPWLDTSPPDPAGIRPDWTQGGTLSPDGRHYVYSYSRTLDDLVLVAGLE